ncbi:hypothetical protein [Schleiferilactobacillus perolens]|uniref:Uncharacterized protein n=1 Tax=Schleiferilactobacillus perolens DSM 12744 TaxID=1423792 RepID=A0A0R1MXQ0_9LACO|nr:hypothetical protein [Schleiferilactobacillus perolens]KRL10724.1 hypothetical protein FD09_GL000867 [Schleiferilactobacillus perolens DSM 12744]
MQVDVKQGMSITAAELSGTIAQMAVKLGQQALIIDNLTAENNELKDKAAKETENKIQQKVGGDENGKPDNQPSGDGQPSPAQQ